MKSKEEKNEKEITQVVLDSYFSTRMPNAMEGMTFAMDDKTTQQIIDELTPTLLLSDQSVVEYMVKHDYFLVTAQDGSLVWRIYRMR